MARKRFNGKVMSDARKAAGLNQAELSDHVGRNRVTISDIERGRLQPGRELAEQIARRLGVDLECFYEAPAPVPAPAGAGLSVQERQVVEAMRRVGPVGGAQIWAFAQGLASGAGAEAASAASELADAMESATRAAREADASESGTGSA
jgi:DNA-binding XRE family transcriptional regulator